MDTYDPKRDPRRCLRSGTAFAVVDVPPVPYLSAVGHGDPNTSALYRDVVTALYTVSYAVRAVVIAELGRKHVVGPLEGLWWAEDLSVFTSRDKDAWHWRLMISQPDWVTDDLVAAGVDRARARGELPELERVGFDSLTEGRAVQVLHVGPYDAEGPTLARLHEEFLPSHDLVPRGHHHEVYLSDARRTAPEKLRTILRQPVDPA